MLRGLSNTLYILNHSLRKHKWISIMSWNSVYWCTNEQAIKWCYLSFPTMPTAPTSSFVSFFIEPSTYSYTLASATSCNYFPSRLASYVWAEYWSRINLYNIFKPQHLTIELYKFTSPCQYYFLQVNLYSARHSWKYHFQMLSKNTYYMYLYSHLNMILFSKDYMKFEYPLNRSKEPIPTRQIAKHFV